MTKPLTESDILLMFAALAAFVALARLLGDFAARLRQPQVLGELLAGIVIGPSVLGLLAPGLERDAARAAHILEPISAIGIILLLALIGMETDFAALKRDAGPALLATIGGVILPLGAGFAFGMAVPEAFVGPGGSRVVFAMFLALAMSISAVTVIAKVLVDLGQMRRSAAKIILTGGIFDETLGWILLAVISGFATASGAGHAHAHGHGTSAGPGDVVAIVAKAVAFLAGAAFFGRRIVSFIVRIVRDRAIIDDAVFTVTILLAIAFAAITEALGLHQVLGAFVFGVVAGTVPRIDRETVGRIRVVTRGFFVPLFFVFAGMKVDLGQLAHRDVLLIAAGFIAIAILGKVVGCTIGGTIARMPLREALLVGIGMSARGSMEIVLAVLGLGLGILTPAIFSVIVLLSVVTIVLVPAGLRFAFAAFPPSQDERKRIEREDLDDAAYTPGLRRVLVPLLLADEAGIGPEAARALARSKAHVSQPLELVMLRLDGEPDAEVPAQAPGTQRLIAEVNETNSERPIEIEELVVDANRAAQDEINDTVKRGYELAIMGVIANRKSRDYFGRVVNGVIRDASCDVLVIWANSDFNIDRVKNIIVPLTGKEYARAGGDLAISLASGLGAAVRAVNVRRVDVEDRDTFDGRHGARTTIDDAVSEMRERADLLGVSFESSSRSDTNPSRAIVQALREAQSDLCIIGASDQSRRGRPFFGDIPDTLLRSATMPVGLLIVRSSTS